MRNVPEHADHCHAHEGCTPSGPHLQLHLLFSCGTYFCRWSGSALLTGRTNLTAMVYCVGPVSSYDERGGSSLYAGCLLY